MDIYNLCMDGWMVPHHGEKVGPIGPKFFMDFSFGPWIVFLSVLCDINWIIIVKMSSFIKISNFFSNPDQSFKL